MDKKFIILFFEKILKSVEYTIHTYNTQTVEPIQVDSVPLSADDKLLMVILGIDKWGRSISAVIKTFHLVKSIIWNTVVKIYA